MSGTNVKRPIWGGTVISVFPSYDLNVTVKSFLVQLQIYRKFSERGRARPVDSGKISGSIFISFGDDGTYHYVGDFKGDLAVAITRAIPRVTKKRVINYELTFSVPDHIMALWDGGWWKLKVEADVTRAGTTHNVKFESGTIPLPPRPQLEMLESGFAVKINARRNNPETVESAAESDASDGEISFPLEHIMEVDHSQQKRSRPLAPEQQEKSANLYDVTAALDGYFVSLDEERPLAAQCDSLEIVKEEWEVTRELENEFMSRFFDFDSFPISDEAGYCVVPLGAANELSRSS